MPTHLALPLRVTATGRLAALEQDSAADVAQSVALLLGTRRNDRLAVPDYGTPASLGIPDVDVPATTAAVESWEPRAKGCTVTVGASGSGAPRTSVTLPPIDGAVMTITAVAAD